MQELKDLLKSNEWVVCYIWGDFCKVCESNKEIIKEVKEESPDIKFLEIDIKNPDYTEMMKAVDFESLPYYSIHHSKKEDANPEDPMTTFCGGELRWWKRATPEYCRNDSSV